jgi:hypothetical protein
MAGGLTLAGLTAPRILRAAEAVEVQMRASAREGVYDYYCLPHEQAGMVGRIVVGQPSGPGALPFDYFKGRPGASNWKPVPDAARKTFPAVERIVQSQVVRRTELPTRRR